MPKNINKDDPQLIGILSVPMSPATFKLTFNPPYFHEGVFRYLSHHSLPLVEEVEDFTYKRCFLIEDQICAVEVQLEEKKERFDIGIYGECQNFHNEILSKLSRMFDLGCEPEVIETQLAQHSLMQKLVKMRPGVRMVGHWDLFETVVYLVLAQLVSVRQARALTEQLVLESGLRVIHPQNGREAFLFPPPIVLAQNPLSMVRTTLKRKETIREVARLFLQLESENKIPESCVSEFIERLKNIRGIGPWTTQSLSMRAFGNQDIFPAQDLILKRAIALSPGLDSARFSPWRSYFSMHLWEQFARKLK